MRDGVRLFTTIYHPRDTTRDFPILLARTPYGSDSYLFSLGPDEAFEREGFIFVFQDVRGAFSSEGVFEHVRPRSVGGIDESTDGYDTIEWLVRNVPHNNGRVGAWGISYLGFYAVMAAISGHPALVAVSPQAPVIDWFRGDDIHHNGALFLSDAFSFSAVYGRPRGQPSRKRSTPFDFGTPDGYRYFLRAGPFRTLAERTLGAGNRLWEDILGHPTYDDFWRLRNPLPYLPAQGPAWLVVGSWFDSQDLWGTLALYRRLRELPTTPPPRLVMGPWFHGQWWFDEGRHLGDQDWGQPTATDYIARVLLPFFVGHLKGRTVAPSMNVSVFETGANRWRDFAAWPPPVSRQRMELSSGGRLVLGPATGENGFYEYLADPAHPVPYLDRITSLPAGSAFEYMVTDQRFASTRPDVLSFESGVLGRAFTVAGPISVTLHVAVDAEDADFVVKLVDVWPDSGKGSPALPTTIEDALSPAARYQVAWGGYQQLVRADVLPARFRRGFDKPVALRPGVVEKVSFQLPDVLHRFRQGHRLMVQIQSSWFPLVAANPQPRSLRDATGFPRTASVRVHFGAAAPTVLEFGVLPEP